MRVLVCGGRNYRDRNAVFAKLNSVHAHEPITLIIHGDADGADRLADTWACANDVAVLVMRARWAEHGRAAGPIRNQLMLDDGKPDRVVAFPGGAGTADMVRRAKRAHVPVEERQ